MRVIDLTNKIRPGPPAYPGDPPIVIHKWASIAEDGYYMNFIFMGEHAGTHVDAPAHFIEGGQTVDKIPVERLVAPAIAVDARNVDRIGLEQISDAIKNAGPGYYLVVVTGYSGSGEYPPITMDAAKAIVEAGIYGLALDTPSPDYPPYPVHRLLLSKGIIIVENLRNSEKLLDYDKFTLIVAPLPVEGGSGAPARVLALIGEPK